MKQVIKAAKTKQPFPIKKIVLCAGIGVAVLLLVLLLLLLRPKPPQPSVTQTPAPQPTPPNSILVTAAGDMLAHDTVNQSAKTDTGYDYTPLFSEVEKYMSAGDIRFCNQEGLSAGERFGITGYPAFNAPTEFPRDLNKIGCNTINLANNHMADKGQDAVNATLDAWKPLKTLAVAGANRSAEDRDNDVRFISQDGHTIAFVSFNEQNNNISASDYITTLLNDETTQKLMKAAATKADFVIVSVHWMSYEDQTEVGPIETEWSRKLADLGADLIIGTGPHVLQRAEWLQRPDGKRTFVWYSIGNFMSSQLALKELIGGLAMIRLDEKDGKLVIAKVGILPTYMHYDWSKTDEAAENLLTRSNLKVYPLTSAVDEKLKARFATDSPTQLKYVSDTLGSDVTLVTPQTFPSF